MAEYVYDGTTITADVISDAVEQWLKNPVGELRLRSTADIDAITLVKVKQVPNMPAVKLTRRITGLGLREAVDVAKSGTIVLPAADLDVYTGGQPGGIAEVLEEYRRAGWEVAR